MIISTGPGSLRLTFRHGTSHTKFQVTTLGDRHAPGFHSFCEALNKVKNSKLFNLAEIENPKLPDPPELSFW